MDGWTLRLVIPNHEDGGAFPAEIIVDEDDYGRDDMECETRRYVPDSTSQAKVVRCRDCAHCEVHLDGSHVCGLTHLDHHADYFCYFATAREVR